MPKHPFRLRRLLLISLVVAGVTGLWGTPSPTLSQDPAPQRIESDDASIQQNGSWVLQTSPNASGGSYLYSSGDDEDILTLEFSGVAVEIVYVAGPSLGTLAVEVDDTVLRTVITTADSTAYQRSTRIDYLTDEAHTLRVYAQEGGIIGVDAFVVTLGGKAEVVAVNNPENTTRATICSPTNGIHRVSVTSLGMQAVDDSNSPRFSTDGRYVAFYSSAPLVPGDGDIFYDVYVYDRQTCEVELISVSTAGVKGDSSSYDPRISGDGRYVVYYSFAANLVTGDTNAGSDIFLRDRLTATTTRVSVSSSGVQSNAQSFSPDISADGRLIVFASDASNLIAGDTNGERDIFGYNRTNGNTFRISVSGTATQATGGNSYFPMVSATGQYVTFMSEATNLVAGDTNAVSDVFVRDRQGNTTTRVSVATGGAQGNFQSRSPAITSDGNLIVFESDSSNLVVGDTNGESDIFVHDRTTATTTRVSVATGGAESSNGVYYPDVSDDGRYVVFESLANNLTSGDTNGDYDIFLHDRTTATTTRVSVGLGNIQSNNHSENTSISGDGRFVGFNSEASNLVPNDTNGNRDVFVTPLIQPGDDSLALFSPLYNQVNLIDTLADNPPYTAFTGFSAYAPATGGQWVMGDWDGDGQDTPGLYANFVFYFTNVMGESQASDWGGFWIGLNAPVVAGRYSSTGLNDCIGAVDSVPTGGVTIFALYYTCDMSGTNPAPPLSFQWLSSPLPDPTFTGTFQFSAGDFNGDGLDSIAVRRNEYIAYGNVNPAAGNAIYDLAQYIGVPGTGDNGSLVIGDWDGNGADSFGLYYQNGELYYRNDLDFNSGVYFNQTVGTPFGNVGIQAVTWR